MATAPTSERSPGKYCATSSRTIDPIAKNGMISSPNYMASTTGLAVLRRGGNAIDAAIAVAATMNVVYPMMTSLGGDNFWLIYNAKTQEVKALNASGRAGSKATIDFYMRKGFDRIPSRGYLSAVTVPGTVSGWDAAYSYARDSMYGTSLNWKDLFDDAIMYAQEGFPVTPSLARWLAINTDTSNQEFRCLQRFERFQKMFLKDDGTPYHVGEVMRFPQLAESYRIIAEQGASSFYTGILAKEMIKDIESNGGVLTFEDFAKHTAEWVDPLTVDYREFKAFNLPPNSQGIASLEILNILNNFDVKKLEEGSADYYHLMVEATKEAFVDRDTYLSDPVFTKVPVEHLLSKQHGKDQATHIEMNRCHCITKPLDPKGDTVWIGVVDKYGNAVSLIQSIYHDFGSGIVAGDTGILLQNRGSFFSLDPSHVNHLEPHKRTFHTLTAGMLLRDKRPYLVYGTMGGEGQPQTQAAIVTRVVDFGMLPQDAVAAPRWLHGRTWGAESNSLKVESRIPQSVVEDLKKRGHPVEIVDDYTDCMGHAGAIMIHPESGLLYGATDPRSDGLAVGY